MATAMLDFLGELVELDKDQEHKLRELIKAQLFLVCLNDTLPRGSAHKASDAPPNPNQSQEEMFHAFVNKLAQICDFEPHGDTITALAVLWAHGRLCYVLASNRRGTGALNNVRAGLKAFLDILKSNVEAVDKVSDEVLEESLMREILRWNHVRVRCYLVSLTKELQACIKECDTDSQGQDAKSALQELAQMLPDTTKGGQKSDGYIFATIRCIKTIQDNRKSPVQKYIDFHAARDKTLAKPGSWSNLQHAAGRLLSYQYAVQTLVYAHHIWSDTDLFRDFDIQSVRSSKPLQVTLSSPSESAETIINRAPGYEQFRKQELKRHAAEMQSYGLDKQLEAKWGQKIHTIVHAEMLLHAWLENTEGGVESHRFFQGWRYIGSSKPLCRTCQDYFNDKATPVQFRSGHPNTYLTSRLPDMYVPGKQKNKDANIKAAKLTWCQDMGEMKKRVYAAAVRILEEKVAVKKAHDSNTYTDRITGVGDVNYLASWLKRI